MNKRHVTFGSLYAGAGGPNLGAQMAGLECVWAIEPRKYFNIKTFRYNFPEVAYSTELEAFYNMPVDVIWGSPSCGEISSSTRNSTNSKNMQLKEFGDFEYTMFVNEIIKRRPLVFVLENIPSVKNFVRFESTPAGFVCKHQISRHQIEIHDYYIEEHRVTPTEVGIPQVRDRLFIIGSLFPLRFMLTPPWEDKRKEMSIRAIFEELDALREKGVILPNDNFPVHSEEKIEKMSRIRPGEGLYGGINNKRLDADKPSPVIMSSATNYIHPWYDRLLTVRENATLMGYPKDFVFFGSDNRCRDQVGKGIVPQVAEFILSQVKTFINKTRGINE